jgi:hypothetical protein
VGFFSDYTDKNGSEDAKRVVNVEWVLKKLDEIWATFTRNKNGLVPAPGGSTTTKYLREDGTWNIPPNNFVQISSPKFTTAYNDTITNGHLNLPQISIGEFRIHNGFITSSNGTYYCRLPSIGRYTYSLFASSLYRDSGAFKRFKTANNANIAGGSNIYEISSNESTYLIIFYTQLS